jgi:hypothetical protein
MFELLLLAGLIYVVTDKLYVEYGWKTVDFIAAMCIPVEMILIIGIFASLIFGQFQYISIFF